MCRCVLVSVCEIFIRVNNGFPVFFDNFRGVLVLGELVLAGCPNIGTNLKR